MRYLWQIDEPTEDLYLTVSIVGQTPRYASMHPVLFDQYPIPFIFYLDLLFITHLSQLFCFSCFFVGEGFTHHVSVFFFSFFLWIMITDRFVSLL